MSTLSSLHIGTGKKTGTFSKTLDYVPGRTLRGMIGYHLYNNNKQLFDELRINEDQDMKNTGVFFKDAHPMCRGKKTFASPMSLAWCKKCEHLMEHEAKECGQFIEGKQCLHEGKKVTGFITEDALKKGTLENEKASLKTHIETKCPIMRKCHTSPGSEIAISPYHIESISPETDFWIRCLVEEAHVDDLRTTLCEAGVFRGLGGYKSRGYGFVAFKNFKEKDVSDIMEDRTTAASDMKRTIMVTNSPMVIKDNKNSIIGFGSKFEEYVSRTLDVAGFTGVFNIRDQKRNVRQKLSESIARGWSIEPDNRVSEIIPCIGLGSCLGVTEADPKVLAALEIFGIGNMTNSGYGDVYFMEGQV